jgi:hypothetical protein
MLGRLVRVLNEINIEALLNQKIFILNFYPTAIFSAFGNEKPGSKILNQLIPIGKLIKYDAWVVGYL